MPIESLQTAQFRHGPLELAGPILAAIVIATEPETRDLDLGARGTSWSHGASAAVVVVTGGRHPGGRDRGSTSARSDRLLAPGGLDPAASSSPGGSRRCAGREPGVLRTAPRR